MSTRNHFDELEQANARIDTLLWLPGALSAMESYPDGFLDFCEDIPDDPMAAIFTDLPDIRRFITGDIEPFPEDVAGVLFECGVYTGFLAKIATPVTEPCGGEDAFTYSWGWYRTQWRYAKSLDDVTDMAVAFAKECQQQDREKEVS